ADVPAARRGGAERGESHGPLRSGGLCPRVPDPRGRDRGLLPDVRGLCPRVRPRCALERPGLRDCLAAPAAGELRSGPELSGLDGRAMTPSFGMAVDREAAGLEMSQLVADLYPICRSITGNGVRETLRIVQKHAPLTLHEVPTGTRVLDWTVPREWNI